MSAALLRWFTLIICFGIFSQSPATATHKPKQADRPDFSGNWTLDLQASGSLEPLMRQIAASPIDIKYATSTSLKATLRQTDDVLTVATRGPAFALDQTLYLDGRSDSGNLQLLGATSVNTKTAWSKDDKQLVETHQIKTKEGKEGELIIKRYLIDEGKTLVVAYALQLGANQTEAARQIWRKQASDQMSHLDIGPARLVNETDSDRTGAW